MVADSHHFDEEQDPGPDPYFREKSDPDQGSTFSVADPHVYPGSQIRIFIHLGSRTPDPTTATKEDRGKK